MAPSTSRRAVLLAAASATLPLAGCSAMPQATQQATIHLVNDTPSEQELYAELTHGDDDHAFGRVTTVPASSATAIETNLPARRYELLVTVDDVEPRPARTTTWTVADDDCENAIYCALASRDGAYGLRYLDSDCSASA
jgi:uncharacterized lipoprotein